MLAAERQETILARLARDGTVVASTLVAELGVSDDTLRRDLQELARRGLLRRVHGGAMPVVATSFAERAELDAGAKAALAAAALPLIADAGLLVVDGGTTNVELARRLGPGHAGTLLTNSPPIAMALAGHPRAEVIVLGGRLDKESLVTVGPEPLEELRAARPDVCVLGVCSIDLEAGITATDREQAELKRAMLARAGRVIALATADKLQTAAAWSVAPLDVLTHLVTDAPAAVTAPYAAAGIVVVRP